VSEGTASRRWPSTWFAPAGPPTPSVLFLSGELDVSTAPAVSVLLNEHLLASRSSVIVVDLSAVTFMDTSGMDPLVTAYDGLARTERLLVLTSSSRPVLRLFHVVQPLGSYPLIDEALRSARPLDGVAADPQEADNEHLVRDAIHLRAARHDRAVLEQAKGVLMALHGCDADQAAALVSLVADRRRVAVSDIAAGLVAMANAHGLGARSPAGNPLVHAAVQSILGRAHALDVGPDDV
jgi:anti-anti-sigma factor